MPPAVILAGGLATRLRPLTETIPKALVDVAGEPFLAHQLRLLAANGIRHVVLCAGYLGGMIREFAGDGARFGVRIDYSFDWPVLLGTAGAIRKALPLVESEDRFFVVYGDSYLPCDYRAVQRAFEKSGRLGLMTVYRNEGQYDTSNVEFGEGRILAYDKKNRTAAMHHIDYGLGVFRWQAFHDLAEGQVHDLAALYQDLLRRGELAAFEVPDRFYEIGSFEGLQELTEYLQK